MYEKPRMAQKPFYESKLFYLALILTGVFLGNQVVLSFLPKYSLLKSIVFLIFFAGGILILCSKRIPENLLLLLVLLVISDMRIFALYRDSAVEVYLSPIDFPLAILIVILFVQVTIARRYLTFNILDGTILTFILWTFFSSLQARYPSAALVETLQLLKVFSLYLCVRQYVRDSEDLVKVLFCLGLGVLLQAAFIGGQTVTGSSLGLDYLGETQMELGPVTRYSGMVGHPNILGGVLVLLLPCFLAMYLSAVSKRQRLFFLFVFIVGDILLISTYSRAAILSFSISLIFLVFMIPKYLSEQGRKRFHRLLGISVMLVVVLGLFAGKQYISSFFDERRMRAAYSRIPSTILALETILDNPIFGVGSKNYRLLAHEYVQKTKFRGELDIEWASQAHIHNMFLRIGAENGLPGLILFLLFLFFLFIKIKDFLKTSQPSLSPICLALSLGLLGFLIMAQIGAEYDQPSTRHLFWLLIGLVVALISQPNLNLNLPSSSHYKGNLDDELDMIPSARE